MYRARVLLEAALEAGRSVGLRADELAPSLRRLEELQRREEASKALEEAMRRPFSFLSIFTRSLCVALAASLATLVPLPALQARDNR